MPTHQPYASTSAQWLHSHFNGVSMGGSELIARNATKVARSFPLDHDIAVISAFLASLHGIVALQ